MADAPGYPKVLVWDRDRDEWAAGAGAVSVYSPPAPATLVEIERELARRARAEPEGGPGWIGGLRFAVGRPPGAAWRAFGAGLWIRPRTWWTRRDGVERHGVERDGVERDGVERDGIDWDGTEGFAGVVDDGEPRFGPGPTDSARLRGESPDAYLDRVRAALTELESARLDKIVLARCVLREGGIDPVATLERMAGTEAGGTLYWIALDEDEGFFGLTPETLYRRRGERVETEALAGTGPLGDAAGAALLADAKSLREHAYVRDAIVQALEPIASELRVAPAPELHRMARLQHLRTPITARLRESRPLLARLHPTPAVCGTPQAEAEAAIARLESEDRGFYAGAVGWCGRDGESMHVALRGARYGREACSAHLGAGIVRGSVPEAELRELELKAEALFESFTEAGSRAAR